MTPRSQGCNTSAPASANRYHIANGTSSSSSAAPNGHEPDSEERQKSYQMAKRSEQNMHPKGKGVSHPPPRHTTLIRRVHAIVTVPVKEEDDEEEEILPDEELQPRPTSPHAQVYEQDDEPESSNRAVSRQRRTATEGEGSRRRKGKRPVIHEDSADSQDERSGSGENDASDFDDENDASYVPNTRRDEDDEDELMIGVEVCANKA